MWLQIPTLLGSAPRLRSTYDSLRDFQGLPSEGTEEAVEEAFQTPGAKGAKPPVHTEPSSRSFPPAAKVTWSEAGRTARALGGGGAVRSSRRRR